MQFKFTEMNAFVKYILVGLVSVLAAACDDNEVAPSTGQPLEIALCIENEDGEDLLNPSTPGNIVNEECEFYFYGKQLLIDPALIKGEIDIQKGESYHVAVEDGGYYSDKHYFLIGFPWQRDIDLYDMRLRIGPRVYVIDYSGGKVYVDGALAEYSRYCVKLVY